MTVSGTWKNSYGSVMTLSEAADGVLVGTYASSTGSTGKYHVLGWAAAEPAGDGQALAIAIFWRSFVGGTPDPSWHWVSGMSGQKIEQGDVPNLVLIHAMVATDDFPGLAPVGTYLDKLIFAPVDAGGEPAPTFADGEARSPVSGSWSCVQRPDTKLTISSVDEATGAVVGELETAAGTFPCVGFADPEGAEVGRVGLSVAARIDAGHCLCLSGSLELARDLLSLLCLDSRGTTVDASYTQTTGTGLDFRRC